MLTPEILLTIKLNGILFADPRRIELLRQIKNCHSINQAAKLANVSYKTAWDNIDAMTKVSPQPLLERNIGGKNGGGTQLTVYAERLLQLYELTTQLQEKAFAILHDQNISLDNLLIATAHSSLQSSARNQFFGEVISYQQQGIQTLVKIHIEGLEQAITASITAQSYQRLKLHPGKEVMLMVKAPWVKLFPLESLTNKQKLNYFIGTVISTTQNQAHQEVVVQLGENLSCCATTEHIFTSGDKVHLHINPEQIILSTLY
ncbi:molybdenum-dependent transcriptional regulator [Mergibacter septicus]|uniref:TOBE domain-containing protein n=1 Tax=Mergibacter septicus TaxID=221402 RepID=UPI0011793CB1|nr:TOBE domain-containing protein [Mergibacter septicus]AWX13619.1 molybdenum-dependent transcriptional regulator [Mergibacter septicus]